MPSRPETFREPVPAGLARVAWNFHLTVLDGDAATARRFTWYWRLIKPGSAAIRWAIPGLVKRTAERTPVCDTHP